MIWETLSLDNQDWRIGIVRNLVELARENLSRARDITSENSMQAFVILLFLFRMRLARSSARRVHVIYSTTFPGLK